MSWYYTREPGQMGEVFTDEGKPQGALLSEILRSGPLPLRAGLELIAAMADILTIAEEDSAVHGDLKPGMVRVSTDGAVSVEAYGMARRGGRAPEGRVVGIATDTYGLGVVLHAVLSSQSLGAVPRDRDGHDDHIVSKLIGIDWGELAGKSWLDPVMHFLCSMLAHDPAERPHPLDVANILGEVAQQVPGEELSSWSSQAVQGQPSPRPVGPPVALGDEDLSGPQSLGRAVSQTGAFSRRKTGRAKGECTAFWSREKISEMLDDDVQASAPAPRPRSGRRDLPAPPVVPPVVPESGRATRSVDAYPQGTPAMPEATITGQAADEELQKVIAQYKASLEEPSTGEAQGVRPPGVDALEDSYVPADGAKNTGARAPIAPAPPSNPPAPPAPPPAAQPPAPDPVAAPPRISPGRAGVTPPVAPIEAEPERVIPWMAISLGIGGVAIAIAIAVLAAVLYQTRSESLPQPAVSSAQLDTAAPVQAEQPSKAKKKDRKDRKDRKDPKAKKPQKKDKKAVASRAAPTGTFVVKFKSPDAETRLECGDGQRVNFIGTTRVTFQSVTTCRVMVGDAQGAVVVREPSQFVCGTNAGGRAYCSKR